MPISKAIEGHMEQCTSFRRAFWIWLKKEMTGNIWDSSHGLTDQRKSKKVFNVIIMHRWEKIQGSKGVQKIILTMFKREYAKVCFPKFHCVSLVTNVVSECLLGLLLLFLLALAKKSSEVHWFISHSSIKIWCSKHK